MRRYTCIILSLALLGAASVPAQTRPGGRPLPGSQDSSPVERVRRTLRGDLAETFPAARLRLVQLGNRIQANVEVETSGVSPDASLKILSTLYELTLSNVTLQAPGLLLSNDSTFTIRNGDSTESRRAIDLRRGLIAISRPSPVMAPAGVIPPMAPRTVAGAVSRPQVPAALTGNAAMTLILFVSGLPQPLVQRFDQRVADSLRAGETSPAEQVVARDLGYLPGDPVLRRNLKKVAAEAAIDSRKVIYFNWVDPTLAIPMPPPAPAVRPPVASPAGPFKPPVRRLQRPGIGGRSALPGAPLPARVAPASRRRSPLQPAGKNLVAAAGQAESRSLAAERAALDELAAPAGAPIKRPWETLTVPVEPTPVVSPPPAMRVMADLIDLPTARITPRDQVIVHALTSFREIDAGYFSNVLKASQRVQEFDFRVGLTRRIEASIRPFFADIDITPAATGTAFSTLSADQGSASVGIRYRLPFQESIFKTAIGVDAAIVKDADREFLLPEDYERLRRAYLVISDDYGSSDSTWHASVLFSPFDVPAGTPDNSMLKVGFGFDHRVTAELRALIEVAHERYENSIYGRFGKLRGGDQTLANLGLRGAFDFATIDVFARELGADGVGQYGIALHASL